MRPFAVVQCQQMLAVTNRLFSHVYALNAPVRNWRRTRFRPYLVRKFVVYQNRLSPTSYRRQFRTVLVDNFQIQLQTPLHVSRLSSNLYRDDHTYRQLYRRFDRYNDGKIGVDEFVSRSRELGLQVTEQEMRFCIVNLNSRQKEKWILKNSKNSWTM